MSDWLATFEGVAESWRPDAVRTIDVVDPRAPTDFAALLDQPSPVTQDGDVLPPLWHWFLHLPIHPRASLGTDGHPRTSDGLLPPLPHERRRMFGGGTLEVIEPLRCGDRVMRTSEVIGCRATEGGSGPLLLTTIRHTLSVAGGPRVVEEQQVVYLPPRDHEPAGDADLHTSAPVADDATWSLDLSTDPVLLFRFSALTANAHRIHYDRDFARKVEGHPDLVVHGPMSALLLAELPRRHAPERPLTHIRWRARRPAYVGQPIRITANVAGDEVEMALHAGPTTGAVAGTATLAREKATA